MTNHPNRNRKIRVELTRAEYDQVMHCIGNFTDANARDIDEMLLCGFTRAQVRSLLAAEVKLMAAGRPE